MVCCASEEKAARERAREAFKGINALLKKCAEDEYFQDDLKQPTVIMVRCTVGRQLSVLYCRLIPQALCLSRL